MYTHLKLYAYLEQLQKNILHTNTGSLICIVKEGQTPLEQRSYLEYLTDELEGDTIQEFVELVPKPKPSKTQTRTK